MTDTPLQTEIIRPESGKFRFRYSGPDAIVVPSARSIEELLPAQQLAADLGAWLIDVREQFPPDKDLPQLGGDALRAGNDIAQRRRAGIRLAAREGASTVLLMDDDIGGLDVQEARWGMSALHEGAEACAYTISHFPDNSAVFHAWRAGGREPGVSPSGAAVLLNVKAALREEWRWASIYNEDWLFLSGLSIALSRPHVSQVEYDPWKSGKSSAQEAGEVLAEGWEYLRNSRFESDCTRKKFWKWRLEERAGFLRYLKSLRMPKAARASVEEARGACADLKAEELASWMRAWHGRRWITGSIPSSTSLAGN